MSSATRRAGWSLALLLLAGSVLRAQQSAPDTPAQTMPSAPEPAAMGSLVPSAPSITLVSGRAYIRPTAHDQFIDYLKDSYGIPGTTRSFVRSLYGQARGKPETWGTDWAGYGQRFGSAVAVTAINGNVRYGMENLFHEDMRYYPCHKCSAKKKIENALLAEITARHDVDGHRFFTLTPMISDFSGPVVANSLWIPDRGPEDGIIGSRVVMATRIGGHLFKEFVQDKVKWLNFKGDR